MVVAVAKPLHLVGDAAFQERSSGRIEAFRRAGTAVVLVNHDMNLITHICERTIWLRDGEIAKYGESSEIAAAYLASLTESDATL